MKATFQKYVLNFIKPGGTSRGVLKVKDTWFLMLQHEGRWGIGECNMFRGLSADDRPDFESKLAWTCDHILLPKKELYSALYTYPAIQFGVETAFRSLNSTDPFTLFPSNFTNADQGIPINGLVWMGTVPFMKKQIAEKLKEGFTCIKLKIGAVDFNDEIDLIKSIRKEFSASEIELRVDANGAFSPEDALEKLKILSDLHLHSIEQPIASGQWEEMANLCAMSPLPIALDEELIGVFEMEEKRALLERIQPQYIILKPSLIGGFQGSDSWIALAEELKIGWWITSALESNVGLNAISQYTFTKSSKLPQGLGTGSLFSNNIKSPLNVLKGEIKYDATIDWDVDYIAKITNLKL